MSDFQQSVSLDLVVGFPGDFLGAVTYPTKPFQCINTGVTIGRFAWQTINSNPETVEQVKGSNTYVAGLVARSNANVTASLGLGTTYSMAIPAGQQAEIMNRGEMLVILTTVVGSSAVLQNSIVYVDPADGTLVANGGGTMTSYTATTFVFLNPSASLIAGATVGISNVSTVQ